MSPVFADTGYYLALLNVADELHPLTLELTPPLVGGMVTTAWVLTELADALSRPPHRSRVVEFINDCVLDPRVTVVPATQALFQAGFGLFARRPDKEWSLTDCISFVVMQEQGITDALSGDRHFEQAGFHILLK